MNDVVKALVAQRNNEELYSNEEIKNTDLMTAKGIAFEGLATHLISKMGGVIKLTLPNFSIKPTYSGDNISKVEYFNGFTQTVINRILSCDVSYTSDLITSEVWKVYDTSDGTTVLVTRTIAYSYTNDIVTNIQVSES